MEFELTIDPASGVPLHRQVYGAIRAAILSGSLRPGDRLPATRALAGRLALSRTTVSEAYGQLQAEGYLLGRHGSGTYVAPDLSEGGLAGPSRRQAAGRSFSLSDWGRRVSADQYRTLYRTLEAEQFRYDFRPHRVARDSFPWEAWRTSVDRALTANQDRLLAYPPSAGHPELLEAVAAHVATYRAVRCSPGQIVVVNGTQQGLNLLAELLLDPGDRVAVEDPGYPAARLALEAHGVAVTRVPVDDEGLIVETLEAAGAHRLVHVTPSHQDPTGATLSLARRLALLDVVELTDCLVFEDDYDSEFRYEGRPVESLQGLDRHGRVVYAGTFSKSVLPGLRIGFLILPEELLRPFLAAKSLWDGGAPMLEQAALAQFLHSGEFERHIRRVRRLYRGRRDALVHTLGAAFADRVRVGERHGGLNLLVTLDLPLSESEIVALAAEVGVGLRGASAYYRLPPAEPTFLMGFAHLDEDQIIEGIGLLESVTAGTSIAG